MKGSIKFITPYLFEPIQHRHQMEDLYLEGQIDFSRDYCEDGNQQFALRIYQGYANLDSKEGMKPSDEASLKKGDKSKKLFSDNEDQDVMSQRLQSRQVNFLPSQNPSAFISATEEEENLNIQQNDPSQGNHQCRNSGPLLSNSSSNLPNFRLKRNGQPLINGCLTNNFISLIWKALRKYLLKYCQRRERRKYTELMRKKSNLHNLSQLFALNELNTYLQQIFETRFLYRHIMQSSIDKQKKKIYVEHLRVIYKGFERKFIDRLK